MKSLGKLFSRFNLYLLKELSVILALSLGILTFILILNRLAKMAELVINKGVEMSDIFFLILYSTPPYLTFTLPMAFLLSVIVVLGRLCSENEILVLKASGVNLNRLFVPVTILAIIITACALINTNLLLPKSSALFKTTLINVIKKGISVEDKEGVFNDAIPGVVVYINRVDTEKKILSGIVIADDRDKDVRQTISAEKGYIHIDSNTLDLYFALQNGNLHRWEKVNDAYRTIDFKNYTFSMNLSAMVPRVGELRKRPYEMNSEELKNFLNSAKDDADRYGTRLDVYTMRVSIPFSALAFVLLTVPLGVKRRMEGKFSGVIYSLLLFIFYYIMMALAENLGRILNLPAIAIAFLPDVIIAAIGIYLLRNLNLEEYSTVSQKIRHAWVYCIEKTK